MAKRLFFSVMAVLFSALAFGQGGWINYDQTYYKISTASDGIHRINFTSLSASGINPNVIDPRNIRVFHRGEEVAIFVQGQEDGKFDPSDFIDFYGKKNDGTLDAKFYKDPAFQGNTMYNIHNDSTAFFLTLSPDIQGKRMAVRQESNTSFPLLTNYQTVRQEVYSENYNLGQIYNPGVYLSDFEEGSGWVSAAITKNNPRTITLAELGQVPAAGGVKIEIGLTGRSATPHISIISVGPNSSNLRQVASFDYTNYQAVHRELEVLPSDFNANGSIAIRVASAGTSATDNVSIAYLRLTYPKTIANGDFSKEIFISGPDNGRIQIGNVLSDYLALEVSDPNNPIIVPVTKSGNQISFTAGIASTRSKIWVENQLDIVRIASMTPVKFRNLLGQSADYIVLSHKTLRRPSSTYPDPVKAHAAHRASAQGGGFDTLVVNIDDLYNQFTFGEKTPLAVYEFLRAYYPIHKPDFLLMIGRAMGIFSTARAGGVNHFYRKNPSVFQFQDIIPPAGYPYADNNYSMGLDPENPSLAAISIGRIPARNPEQVAAYLDKVKEKDALGISEDWQKEVVHLSGGVSAFELNRYFNFLNGFKNIIEGPYMGANVTTYRKRSNSTIELIDISGDINRGTSLVTFFGHGSPSLIDIEIGFASDPNLGYNNKGKYPMLLLNGCDAGNSFGNAYTFGEDWVLTPNKGATNFMAHANIGVDVYLRRYSESFYIKAFSDSTTIYQPVGMVRREAEKWFFDRYGQSAVNRSHAEQLVMLGDPAVRLFPANKADYSVVEPDVTLGSFEGETFNALVDSLKLSFILKNIGRVNVDSLDFKVTRRLPDGTQINYPLVRIPAVYRKDTVDFTIPNTGIQSFGDNIFTLEINPTRVIPEMTFGNNAVTVTKFIPLSGTIHLIPEDFGIVNEADINLIAQIPGKSVEPRNLVIQLDTAANFSSAIRRETRITTSNLANWNVNLFQNVPQRDSVTFYWRSRFLDPREGESQSWTEGSFSFIANGPEGWTQREQAQIQSNQLNNLEVDPVKRQWKYKDTNLDIGVFTFGNQTDSLTFRNTQFYLKGVPYILDNVNNANSRLCPDGSLGLVAFEQRSLTPYLVIPVPGFDILDGRSCGRVPQVIQSVRNAWITQPGQRMLLDYIDGLKEGDYVVIFSVGNVTYQQWPDAVFEKMKEIGANEAVLRNLQNGDPYILYGRKGMAPGEAVEIVSKQNIELETNQQIIEFETEIQGYLSSGSIVTPRIGPSSEWKRFFNQVNSRDWFDEELAYFDVIGVKPTGEEQVLFNQVQDGEIDLSSVNPDLFPFLRLRYAMEDELSTAPAYLDKWQVNYTGVPEGVLIFNGKDDKMNLQEGQVVNLSFEFVNISQLDFQDSILVEWEFNNTTTKKIEKFSKKIPAVKSGEKHEFNIVFNSTGNGGDVQVEVFANPRIILEQTFRNNIIDLGTYFIVVPDQNNAILDVNFDGVYILDGDIVSPTVMITSILKNEKSLILKKDTLGLEIFLKKPCENCQLEKINFSSPLVTWSEATESSSFKVEFRPGPLDDGIYTLRIITEDLGVDKSYEINFEVINESTITNFYPYPNPFSSSTRFVFTVTGSEVPDQIKIQIMTVTGRVVREILQDELGPIRIGNNISDYAWDGRDEFGDQLANGVYIYRVLVRKDGQFVELRGTAGDKAFKQGYGKMYLLR
ncbi:C25 family cysteine peptidase [Aquiflexum sp. LQ15W]|uniref:putative type IX secretion system sortase PorU2 n=1 Tax=Cognataquiflexum nitidum TaxID=2922272 RepID=UPI001F1335C2|nr:C25 family cysteine peptidase [Cognataquiflexum nitidum]MCH6199463.1 C25 family cysteine peptidase [Cognataquiflexum nitidum]